MEQTLLLNATYEPLRVVSWQKAITLLFQDKVEVLAVHDREVRGVSIRIRLPSVLRLLRHVRVRRIATMMPFTRANVYARDNHRCQYCGKEYPSGQLTFDHVVPVARAGRKEWDNIVTCCIPCNRKKGDRLPEEAGMRLVRVPRRPHLPAVLTLTLGRTVAPASWKDFLHWDVTWTEP